MYIPNNWKKMYDGSYAVDGSVAITEDYISDGRLRVRFHKVTGDFDCKYLNLHTLEGCPQEVGGDFNCEGNVLYSLHGAPKFVSSNFSCALNKLETLAECPEYIGGNFSISHNRLKDLKGSPRSIYGWFICDDNPLKTLIGGPEKVKNFSCLLTQLQSLRGAPYVIDSFYCQSNKLQTLSGVQEEIYGHFNCSNNLLESLVGGPKKVYGGYYCDNNNLKDLQGAPEWVGDSFECHDNQDLYDYTWIPKHVGGDVHFSNTEVLTNEIEKFKRIKASTLPALVNHKKLLAGTTIDWAGFDRTLFDYARWIPLGNMRHENLTTRQKKELQALRVSGL